MSELRQRTVAMRPNYENTARRAGRPAGPVPQPAGQRLLRHRRRHGHQHPAAQPRRSDPAPAVLLIDNPDATTAQLSTSSRAPTSPSAARIVTDRATLRKIYEEGTGSIKVQGEWKLEEVGKKQQIVVTSIPYGVDKGKLEADIGVIIAERKLPQLLNLTNEIERKGRHAHRPGDQAGERPEPDHGLSLQAHRLAGELRRTT